MGKEIITSEKSSKLLKEFEKHECEYLKSGYKGAIEGRFTYKFTRTPLGVTSSVECICGKTQKLTDVGDWW